MNNVYFDTETSGLKPGQIGQLSMIIESTNGIEGKNYFFQIDSLDPGAAEVTGRSLDFYREVSKGKVFGDYAQEISDILDGNRLIAHNIKFDESFLSMEFFRLGIPFTIVDKFDTMKFFKPILQLPARSGNKNKFKNPKLEELVNYFKIDADATAEYTKELFDLESSNLHDAMFDTTSMFVACKVYNEIASKQKGYYTDRFSGWASQF